MATLALEYRPKLSDFMASIASETEVLRLDRIDGKALAETVNDIGERAVAISRHQWEASRMLSDKFLRYVDSLPAIMSSSKN